MQKSSEFFPSCFHVLSHSRSSTLYMYFSLSNNQNYNLSETKQQCQLSEALTQVSVFVLSGNCIFAFGNFFFWVVKKQFGFCFNFEPFWMLRWKGNHCHRERTKWILLSISPLMLFWGALELFILKWTKPHFLLTCQTPSIVF